MIRAGGRAAALAALALGCLYGVLYLIPARGCERRHGCCEPSSTVSSRAHGVLLQSMSCMIAVPSR